jgi:hypothetical protein
VKTKKGVRRRGEDVDWCRPRIATIEVFAGAENSAGKKQNRKIVSHQRLDDASA